MHLLRPTRLPKHSFDVRVSGDYLYRASYGQVEVFRLIHEGGNTKPIFEEAMDVGCFQEISLDNELFASVVAVFRTSTFHVTLCHLASGFLVRSLVLPWSSSLYEFVEGEGALHLQWPLVAYSNRTGASLKLFDVGQGGQVVRMDGPTRIMPEYSLAKKAGNVMLIFFFKSKYE